jgi:DNA polymerase III epsilon subunit-like protein
MSKHTETYISVDIETAGTNPSSYSILSIGACHVFNPSIAIYLELKPDKEAMIQSALAISGLDWAYLKENGLPAIEAMTRFDNWVNDTTQNKGKPIFVAFNAAFDWMFVNDYFQRYLGKNPFGHKALDIKSYYMGLHGVTWEETGIAQVSHCYSENQHLSHHALQDAIDQATIFRKMLRKNFHNNI